MSKNINKRLRIRSMAVISMCVAIIDVSSWIIVTFTVNFTLQTLAIFLISAVFGLKKSILAVLVYILIGICGVPIFSGFGAGIAAIVGPTGGYIIGFIFIPFIMNVFIRRKFNKLILAVSMLIALLVCYLFGTTWYCLVYDSVSPVGFLSAISICVIPFVIPDLLKILIATLISARLKPIIDKLNLSGGLYD